MEPTLTGKVAIKIFVEFMRRSGGIVRNAHEIRAMAQALSEEAAATGNEQLQSLAAQTAALANAIDEGAFNLHELITYMATGEAEEVRSLLGVAKKTPNRPARRRPIQAEIETQELRKAKK